MTVLVELNSIQNDLKDLSCFVNYKIYSYGGASVHPRCFYVSLHEIVERMLRLATSKLGYESPKHNLSTFMSVLGGYHPNYTSTAELNDLYRFIVHDDALVSILSWDYNVIRFTSNYHSIVMGVSSFILLNRASHLFNKIVGLFQ